MTPAPAVRNGDRVDDDEAAGRAVGGVVVDQERLGTAEGQPGSTSLSCNAVRRLVTVQAVDIESVVQGQGRRPHRRGAGASGDRCGLRPARSARPSSTPWPRCPATASAGCWVGTSCRPARPRVVVQRDDDGHGGERLGEGAARRGIEATRDDDPEGTTRRRRRVENAPTPPSPRSPGSRGSPRLGPDDVLHGEAGIDQVAVRGDVHLLEVVQQRRARTRACVERCTTLSPSNADMGMNLRSSTLSGPRTP